MGGVLMALTQLQPLCVGASLGAGIVVSVHPEGHGEEEGDGHGFEPRQPRARREGDECASRLGREMAINTALNHKNIKQ